MNAAIVRNPSNIAQINQDLSELWHHILKTAGAKNQKVNLIDKAKEIKELFNDMRSEVDQCLDNLPPKTKLTQKYKAEKISKIM